MLKEFKDFLLRGNVFDLAVAVIIGAAFGAIVDGLVKGIMMPLIAALVKVPDVSGLAFMINGTSIQYGVFLQAVINFLIVGSVLFAMVKAMNHANSLVSKKEEALAEEPKPTAEDYLKEIRDLLAEKK